MGPNKTREAREDSSAERTSNMVGLERAGVQPLPPRDLRQAIPLRWPHFPHLKRLAWTDRSSGPFQLWNSVICPNVIFLGYLIGKLQSPLSNRGYPTRKLNNVCSLVRCYLAAGRLRISDLDSVATLNSRDFTNHKLHSVHSDRICRLSARIIFYCLNDWCR